MLKKQFPWLFTIAILALASCEKSISFRPNNSEPLVVVEATIENGQLPQVILTSSVNYFSEITPDLLANSFIHQAKVEISNGTQSQTLTEYEVPGINGYKLYYYSLDSLNAASMRGELGKKYTLKIEINGKTYTSTTNIPLLTKKIDSLWWEKAPPNIDTNLVRLMGKITDPPGFGNYVRYFTRVNRDPFLPGRNSVFDDQIVDGTVYNIQIDKGIDRNQEIKDDDTSGLFRRGDTITVKQGNIDKATYDFWRTLEYSYASIGNPFSSPTKVLSNINGGGLGYFGGYAVQYITLIIPK